MKKTERLTIIFSIIAIILSVTAIILFVRINNKLSNYDYIQAQSNNAFNLATKALSSGDYGKFYSSLVRYNQCITEAERSFINCVNNNIQVSSDMRNPNCDSSFVISKGICNSMLTIGR